MIVGRSGPFARLRRRSLGAVLALCALAGVGCSRGSEPSVPSGAAAPDVDSAAESAETYLRHRDHARAEAISARIVASAPDDPRGHDLLARILLARGLDARADGRSSEAEALLREALECAETAARLAPADAERRRGAGAIAEAVGEGDRALAHFLAAAEMAPEDAQAPLMAAQILLRTERVDEAEAAIVRTLSVAPDEPMAHATLAMIRAMRGDADGAIEALARSRQLAPADVALRIHEARVLRRLGRHRDAAERLLALPAETRRERGLTVELADSLREIGESQRAADAWEAFILAQAPGSVVAADHVAAAEAWLAAGDADAARRHLADAEALGAPAASVARIRGELDG